MFLNVYRYNLKSAFRQKIMLFWSLAFPILMATFFFVAFGNIGASERLKEPIRIAYVGQPQAIQMVNLRDILAQIPLHEGSSQEMFDILDASEAEARALVQEKQVAAAVLAGDPPRILADKVSVSQVVVKQVVEQVATTQRTIMNLMRTDPKAPFQEIATVLNTSQYTQAVPVNKDLMQPDIIYYFALLAMASLGASTAGAFTIVSQQANKSPEGARNTVSPTSKWTRVFANGLSTYTVQLATTLVVVGYITLVLGKSLGRSLPELLLIVALGTLMGVAMGMAIGALSRGNENMIVGFSVGAYMLSSFLGGLMSADIQRLVDTNLPWLAAINPGSMIVKALYSLFYYGQTEARYLLQMLLAILVFAGLAAISLRRRYHDSI